MDESPNNIYLRKNPSGLHLIDLISATSGPHSLNSLDSLTHFSFLSYWIRPLFLNRCKQEARATLSTESDRTLVLSYIREGQHWMNSSSRRPTKSLLHLARKESHKGRSGQFHWRRKIRWQRIRCFQREWANAHCQLMGIVSHVDFEIRSWGIMR